MCLYQVKRCISVQMSIQNKLSRLIQVQKTLNKCMLADFYTSLCLEWDKNTENNHAYLFYRLSSFPQRTKQTLKSSKKRSY